MKCPSLWQGSGETSHNATVNVKTWYVLKKSQ